ncbi:MAG: hypothetical protein LC777_12950 [Actinobacteria bacterium]|nr:hypothetical protein [Actinomycetota bacterium]
MRRAIRILVPALLAAVAIAPPAPASASASAPCPDARLTPDRANLERINAATLCLLNAERTSRGLDPLKSGGELRKAARAHSANMVRRRFFAPSARAARRSAAASATRAT